MIKNLKELFDYFTNLKTPVVSILLVGMVFSAVLFICLLYFLLRRWKYRKYPNRKRLKNVTRATEEGRADGRQDVDVGGATADHTPSSSTSSGSMSTISIVFDIDASEPELCLSQDHELDVNSTPPPIPIQDATQQLETNEDDVDINSPTYSINSGIDTADHSISKNKSRKSH